MKSANATEWERAMEELVLHALDQTTMNITVGDTSLNVEVASSHTTRIAGLANRDEMPGDGMLFIYDCDVDRAFHRTTMLFPITIRFYDAAGELVHTDEDSVIVKPGVKYRYVLETLSDCEVAGTLTLYSVS